MRYRCLSLFAGIGGLDLGLERTGEFAPAAFVEINPYCRRILAKHWPEVTQYNDVRELTAARLAADGISINAIVGGFPCQDISKAGAGAGLAGERSGLWAEFARLVRELRPRLVIVENVSALLGRGMGDVFGDLAALGYNSFWDCIPACAVGAPHERNRVFIVSYAVGEGLEGQSRNEFRGQERAEPNRSISSLCLRPREDAGGWWQTKPGIRRVAHGISDRVDRITALGNAVVPQVAEALGRAILDAEQAK